MKNLNLSRITVAVVLAQLAAVACNRDSAKRTEGPAPSASVSPAPIPSVAAAASAAPVRIEYLFSQSSAPSSETQIKVTASDVRGKHQGSFGTFNGKITVSNGNPEQATLLVDIDLSSLTTDDAKLTQFLKSSAFLDVEKFPMAHFVSTSVRSGGDFGATDTVTGELELHGVKRSVDLASTVHVRPADLDVDAEARIKRKDFGLNLPGKQNTLVNDEVVLNLLVVATAARAATQK